MKKEFKSLSERQKDGDWMYEGSNTTQKCYSEEDVKEFIKRLKEKRRCERGCPHICEKHPEDCEFVVDWEDVEENAGEKLI